VTAIIQLELKLAEVICSCSCRVLGILTTEIASFIHRLRCKAQLLLQSFATLLPALSAHSKQKLMTMNRWWALEKQSRNEMLGLKILSSAETILCCRADIKSQVLYHQRSADYIVRQGLHSSILRQADSHLAFIAGRVLYLHTQNDQCQKSIFTLQSGSKCLHAYLNQEHVGLAWEGLHIRYSAVLPIVQL